MDELKNWIKLDTYNAVRLSEYRGKFSLMAGSVGDNDIYDKWCNPLRYQNGEKDVPVKKKDGDLLVLPLQITLGEKERALEVLQHLYNTLKHL